MKRRQRVSLAWRRSVWVAWYCEQRLLRLGESWAGTGEPGTRYLDPEHPCAADLDLFGPGSIFERLSAPSTPAGEEVLAAWLLAPAEAEVVRQRQAAVAELRDRPALREELARLAGQCPPGIDHQDLAAWGRLPEVPFPPALAWAALLLPLVSLSAFLGLAAGQLGPEWFAAALAGQVLLALLLRNRATAVLGTVEDLPHGLWPLAAVMARVEGETFSSPLLVGLRDKLAGPPASRELPRLARRLLWAPFGLPLALRPLLALVLQGWRNRWGHDLGRWLKALGELEALAALATYSFEEPQDNFPEVAEAGPVFDAFGLGHPLLPAGRCVRNDLRLDAAQALLIVSGSNMSGKSTLLRSAGVAAVLALAGGPVRATRLKLSPLVVGATLRVQDSLQQGRSRFYAEVLRVRRLLELARGTPPLLYLLDELFQGTNSDDRRTGSEGVLRRLLDAGAVGLVTTHDLALTELAGPLGSRTFNVHFAERFEDGEMLFDYRMKPGVVRSRNGLALMRAVGIEV
jgi:hypothetical protein